MEANNLMEVEVAILALSKADLRIQKMIWNKGGQYTIIKGPFS